MNLPSVLYFDYAATTPADPQVIQAMVECLGKDGTFANPASSSHSAGQQARRRVELARQQVAHLIGTSAANIVWTSGATESNNLALKGAASARGERRGHIITSALEHKAILDTAQQLESAGFDVTYLTPDSTGCITADALSKALRTDTFLVSLMLVNNELGTITDVHTIGKRVREHGALLHVDAAQATGKISIDLAQWPVDLMSLSAHKTYGPKGIGALYCGPRAAGKIHAQIHGGGHEHGLRSGTLATHQIVGMGQAYALAGAVMQEEAIRISGLRQRFLAQLEGLPFQLNAEGAKSVPHMISLRLGQEVLLDPRLAVSSTSACNSALNQASHVLLALGLSQAQALRSIRLSIGRFTDEQQIDQAAHLLRKALSSVRPSSAPPPSTLASPALP